jgi:hypothetical protein
VWSTAITSGAPVGLSRPTTGPSMVRPSWSRFHRAVAKNRFARLWCHVPLTPAAEIMPQTVRRAGVAINPTVIATKVANVRPEKHGQNTSNNRCNDFGASTVDTATDHDPAGLHDHATRL